MKKFPWDCNDCPMLRTYDMSIDDLTHVCLWSKKQIDDCDRYKSAECPMEKHDSELLEDVIQKQRTIIDDDGVMHRVVFLKDIEDMKSEVNQGMNEEMEFPNTFEEFVNEYSFVDSDEVYTNGSELIPTFRVMQGYEHFVKQIKSDTLKNMKCDGCSEGEFSFEQGKLEGWLIAIEQCINALYKYIQCPMTDEYVIKECIRVLEEVKDFHSEEIITLDVQEIESVLNIRVDGKYCKFTDKYLITVTRR